jgi:hypothetical protein
MDVHQFKWMAFGVVRIDDGIALIKRVETEGTPQLCKWLRECGHDWMMNEKNCGSRMRLVAIAMLSNFANASKKRDKKMLELIVNDEMGLICLDIAEKRGLNVRRWGTSLLVNSLASEKVLTWLNERIDVTAKLLASDWDEEWSGWYLKRVRILCCLSRTGNNELLVKILSKTRGEICQTELRELVTLGREKCLADNGALLRLALKHKHMRAQKIKILRQHGFSQSDFASIGLLAAAEV